MHADLQSEILSPKVIYEFDGTVTMYGKNFGRKWIVNGANIYDAKAKQRLTLEKLAAEVSNGEHQPTGSV